MSLVLDPRSLPRERLVALVREMRLAVSETLANLDDWPAPILHPMSVRTARDLLTDALAVADVALEDSDASPELLAASGNAAYSAMIAAIDLMKSHSDLPSTVPRRRT